MQNFLTASVVFLILIGYELLQKTLASGAGCNTFETSSSTITQYDISRDDYIRMYAFLPEEATAHIPLENPMKKYVVATSLFAGLIFAAAFVSAYCVKKKRG